MTKIFAISPTVKESDEKMKEMERITVSPTTPQAAFYPVTLPISSIVARKRCGTSHLIIILLSLLTTSILFYMIPDLFFKRAQHLISGEFTVSGSTSPWAQRAARFDVEGEDDVEKHVLPKLDSSIIPEKTNRVYQNGDVMQENRGSRIALNQDGENVVNDDGEVKQPDDVVPNRFETLKAITTLLKIPGVQQVAVLQNNGRIPDNMMMKPEIAPARFVPPMETGEWDLMNYRRAMREWLLRREMFRRRMLAELERERAEAAERKMSQFIMELQLKEQQESPLLERFQSILPMLTFGRAPPMMWMNNVQPAMETNQRNMPTMSMISPSITEPRIPPMHLFMIPKQQEQEKQQQQQQSAIMTIKLMPQQMLDREVPTIQNFGLDPAKLNREPVIVRHNIFNRLDTKQKKIPVPVVDQPIPLTFDGTPDRDTIFKELRSRAQMQQQMSQTAMMPSSIPSVVPPAQVNSDEIFQELQHRALRIQIEQDRLEAEQQAEKEKSASAEIPVLMIADTFPRRPILEAEQTSGEVTGATSAANFETTTKTSNSGSSSESVSTFFNFFEKGFPENEITNSPDKEQEITLEDNDVKDKLEHSDEESSFSIMPAAKSNEVEEVVKPDEIPLVVKPDEIPIVVKPDEIPLDVKPDEIPLVMKPDELPLVVPESTTTKAPVKVITPKVAYPKPFKPETFPGEPDDMRVNDFGNMLDPPIRLLQTSQ